MGRSERKFGRKKGWTLQPNWIKNSIWGIKREIEYLRGLKFGKQTEKLIDKKKFADNSGGRRGRKLFRRGGGANVRYRDAMSNWGGVRSKWNCEFRFARSIADFGQFRNTWGEKQSFRTAGKWRTGVGGAELGGGDDVIMGDLVDAVSNDLLEIGGEPGKEGQVRMVKFRGVSGGNQAERKILMAFSPMGGSNCDTSPFKIARKSRIESYHNEINSTRERNK